MLTAYFIFRLVLSQQSKCADSLNREIELKEEIDAIKADIELQHAKLRVNLDEIEVNAKSEKLTQSKGALLIGKLKSLEDDLHNKEIELTIEKSNHLNCEKKVK